MAVVFVKTGCIFGFSGSPQDRMFEAKGDSRPMQITDLLVPERVALNMQVADKAMRSEEHTLNSSHASKSRMPSSA